MAMPAAEVTAACSAIPTSKKRSGQRCPKGNKTGRPRHGGRNCHDVVPPLRYFEHRIAESERVTLDGLGRFGRPGRRVKGAGVVQALFLVFFRWPVATPFLGDDVDHDRPVVGCGLAKSLFHAGNIVPVERPYIADAEGLEKCRRLYYLSYRGIKTLQARISEVPHLRQVPHFGLDTAPGRTDAGVEA